MQGSQTAAQGAALAILTFLFRLRWAIAVLLILGSAAGGYAGFRHAVPAPNVLLLAGASALLTAWVGFVHFRHVGLAIITALAPLLGMIAASLAGHGLGAADLLAIYGLGYIAAGLAGGETVRRVLSDGVEGAAKFSLARLLAPCAVTGIAGEAVLALWLFRAAPSLSLHAAAMLVASIAYGLVGTTFGASLLPFGESFHTAANRLRESRERLLRPLTAIVEGRWALSVAGIALVLAVLGWFGAAPFLTHGALVSKPAIWGASALVAFLLAFAVARDWREALAATLALATFTLLALWLWGATAGRFSQAALIEYAAVSAAAYLPMLVIMGGSRRFQASGDVHAVARLRILEEIGAVPYFAVAAAVLAVLLWMILHGSVGVLAVMFLLGGGAAIVVQPAIATALEWFIPRRRSVNQLYGRG